MERALDLIRDAEDFIGAAKDLFKTGRWAKVCFNCQQCIELALRATLNSLGLERKGHDLSDLLEELLIYRRDLGAFKEGVKILDQYYIPTRYANAFYSGSAMEHYTRQQAEEALRSTEELFGELKRIVSERQTSERG